MNIKNRLEEIKREGYQLDFSTIFSNALENYKKIALTAGVVLLLVGLFAIILFGAVIGISIMLSNFNIESLENIKPEDFEMINLPLQYIFIYLIGVILFSGLFSPINAGLIKIASNAYNNQEVSIGTAFEYYKKPIFKDIFVATVLISFFSLTLNSLFEFIDLKFVGGLISIVISFFTFLTIPFIIFGKLNAIEAIQASFLVVSKQILVLIALMICGFLFAMMGVIACCIGIIFTMPILYSLYFCIYNEAVGIEEENEFLNSNN